MGNQQEAGLTISSLISENQRFNFEAKRKRELKETNTTNNKDCHNANKTELRILEKRKYEFKREKRIATKTNTAEILTFSLTLPWKNTKERYEHAIIDIQTIQQLNHFRT